MKKILILVVALTLASCSKDEVGTLPPNYSAFLSNHTPSLSGKLNSEGFQWNYGWTEFQMSNGYANGNGVCSVTDPYRILNFGLSNDDGTTQMTIVTPKMDTSNPNDVANVLSLGEKQFGALFYQFQFSILKNNKYYANNATTIQKLEILKTEPFLDYLNDKHLMVWIKIDNLVLENTNQPSDTLQLKNGLLIADLYGYVFE
jgi:hypothetical protein